MDGKIFMIILVFNYKNKNSDGEQSTIIDLSEKIEMVDYGVIFSKKK